MTLELFAAGAMLTGLVIYALTGGADFGGGVLDALARGPRGAAQRTAIESALAPVWEANHVWLIFVVVVLFTAFPPAFARIGIELHIPVTVLLIAIVLRGAAFVFRQYGPERNQTSWGRVFAWSSIVASTFLGVVLGALTAGGSWFGPLPLVVGLLAVVMFAFLAATYLTVEVGDTALRADFRRQAIYAGGALAIMAPAAAACAWFTARPFARDLLAWPLIGVVALGAWALAIALVCLRTRRHRLARVAAVTTVALVLSGWAFAHYPLLVAPDLTIASTAAPRATLSALVPVLLIGSLILLPSLWWLMRVFKASPREPH